MISEEADPGEVFVWTWLPGSVEPVVAGRLTRDADRITFNYGTSYLERKDRVPLYLPELPLRRGRIEPIGALTMPGVIEDAAPDAWGQRVVMRHLLGRARADDDPATLDTLTYLVESGSDRIGALDFQGSSDVYVPRTDAAGLEDLMTAAESVDQGTRLPPTLDIALLHGSSVGGARPKSLLSDGQRRLIAKFSAATDAYPVVRGEFVAMELARRAGLDVASVELRTVLGRDVLLVERFDRKLKSNGVERRSVVSALTILELDAEREGRYATYHAFAQQIRARFSEAKRNLRELFARITFNVLVGNNDDHAKNHAAFWDGRGSALSLTPAYDICPQPRSGLQAGQAMAFAEGARESRLELCVEAAANYLIAESDAREIIDHQVDTIAVHWDEVATAGRLTGSEQDYFRRRQFLSPFAFQGYSSPSPWGGPEPRPRGRFCVSS